MGGFGRVGMNCLALEQQGHRLVIDCGVAFDGGEWGAELHLPRFDALPEASATLAGVLLTHGHEDHIGALPALLASRRVPVWGPPYALELCRRRLGERFGAAESFDLRAVRPADVFEVGSFRIEALRVTHSTVDSLAYVFDTAAGVVVHSGDFKLDGACSDQAAAAEQRWDEIGSSGVRLLLSDSTNSCEPGRSGTESDVAGALDGVVAEATGRVVVCVFASNVERVRSLGRIARRHGRKLCLLGLSVNKHVEVARELGWLDWSSDLVLPAALARRAERASVLYVATGTQGEARGALRLLAQRSHPALTLEPGDTVVLSSRVIPGRELAVQGLVDALLRQGVLLHRTKTERSLHVSGHACREEQRQWIRRLCPTLFVPIHGNYEQLSRHAELARAEGVREIFVLDEGDALEVTPDRASHRETWIDASPVAWAGGRAVPEPVLRQRRALGRAGVVCVWLRLRDTAAAARSAEPVAAQVRVQTVGVAADPELVERLETVVARSVGGSSCRGEAEQLARAALLSELRRRGMGRPPVVVTLVPGEQGV